jgi:hypothetical protein
MKVTSAFIESVKKLARKHTPQQISDIMGEDYAFIIKVMHNYDIDILTKKDIAINQMYRECHLYTKAEMTARLGISVTTMTTYLKKIDIEFKPDQPGVPGDVKKRRPIYDKTNELKESLAEYVNFPNNIIRIREPYTQSGSPFGIADKMNSK